MKAEELREIVGRMTERPWRRTCGGLGVISGDNLVCRISRVTPVDDATGIAAMASHADALVELVAACERYAQDPTGFYFGIMRDKLAAVHAIGAAPEAQGGGA